MANQTQAINDETPAHDVTDRVLLSVGNGSKSAQDTGGNVTSQPMTSEILDIPRGPSSPTATPSAYDVESLVSSGESEEYIASLSPFPSDGPVSSAENHVSKKSRGVVVKQPIHKLRKLKS
ncbi:cst complex subunit stn1-like [Plakobranchus ocellatus]|uniref:Cst complex subunit stn1-like n=1 Tax=Plakobranchus ocellatus TaxID=259542 RepID=A0AAV4DJW6_9GAST|nr:cst complex subunit stn1-like [Plakobranchus ocellatus]